MTRRQGRTARSLVAALALGSAITAWASPAGAAVPRQVRFAERLANRVEVFGADGANRHLIALQRIAEGNPNVLTGNPNRAAGTPGFDASAEYIAGRLEAAGFQVTRQPFQFDYFDSLSTFTQVAPTPTTYVDQVDFDTADFSGSGTVEGEVVPVNVNLTPPRLSASGCEAADFVDATGASIVAGKIALIQRGTCSFGQKVDNAQAAGAIGVVIFNQGNEVPGDDRLGLVFATLGDQKDIPTVTVSYATGAAFAATQDLVVNISVDIISETRPAENVIAETGTGRPYNVVMAGAHLDSVTKGPGINDNGSGSAALLETALELGSQPNINNKVRFAWWGAEEGGLLGSTHYVDTRTDEQKLNIALYLNFDMVGSPNAGFFVYDGDDSDAVGAGPGPYGSAQIEQTFVDYINDYEGVATEGTDFDGRSDYGPFIGAGIPSGGLFTGAEDIMSPAQAAKWSGQAGVAFDPCYHQACDNLGNVDREVLGINLRAIAYTLGYYAISTEAVNGVPARDRRADVRAASAQVTARTAAADPVAGPNAAA